MPNSSPIETILSSFHNTQHFYFEVAYLISNTVCYNIPAKEIYIWDFGRRHIVVEVKAILMLI